MQINVLFKNFSGLRHTRAHIQSAITKSIGKFERRKDGLRTHIIIGLDRKSNPENNLTNFDCELLIEGPELNRPIVIKKNSREFYLAFKSCVMSGEKALRRLSKYRVKKRRSSKFNPEYLLQSYGAA